MKMTVLVGLPASGKTHWAMKNRREDDVVVCRDDLRMMNYGKWHGDPIDENFITKVQRQMIIAAFENGLSVISADTNLNRHYVQRIVDLASQFQAEVEYVYFDIPPATCIEYDKHRDKKVGAKVINRMARKAGINDKGWIPRHDYYYHKIETYEKNHRLPPALVVDIDGTVAMKSDRSPYDYSRVYEDTVRHDVFNVIEGWIESNDLPGYPAHLVFLSGRNEKCRAETERWLMDKLGCVIDNEEKFLFMRPESDPNTADFIVKDRLFDKYVADRFDVVAMLDDRRQVVTMWRTKGLTVFDVAGNKF